MSTPALQVFLAFGDDPLTPTASATWEDVSAYVSGNDDHMIHRGRNHERDENEAGTAIIVLRNTDRRFDPNNSSGPYLGDIKPMVKIKIAALWLGISYWIFHGYVESWHPDYPGGSVSTCTLECVDAFKYFGLADVHTPDNRAAEVSGDRISYILDSWVFWPASERNIAVGDITVAEMPLDGSALALIQAVTRAERGSFYISKFGTFTFEDRSLRDAMTVAPGLVWGDAADGSELPYSSVSIRYDDSDIFNRIEVTRAGGTKQTMNDVASQGDYFIRTFSSTGLPYASDADALTAAETMLHRYKGARTRLDRMVIDPGVREAAWIPVLMRELSDMITVKRSTLVDGHTTELDGHIEAITWHITKGEWICTWQLSPHFTAPTLGSGTLNTTDDWKVPTLLNSWANFGGTGNTPAGYRKEGDYVTLRGYVTGGATGSHIFDLPPGYIPNYAQSFAVYNNAAPARATVRTDGGVVATFSSGTNIDLSGIRFRVI